MRGEIWPPDQWKKWKGPGTTWEGREVLLLSKGSFGPPYDLRKRKSTTRLSGWVEMFLPHNRSGLETLLLPRVVGWEGTGSDGDWRVFQFLIQKVRARVGSVGKIFSSVGRQIFGCRNQSPGCGTCGLKKSTRDVGICVRGTLFTLNFFFFFSVKTCL